MNYEEIAKWSDIVSAVLFIAVMVWLWLKFIAPAIAVAQANKNKQIAEAERHRDEAKAALDVLQSELEGATRDAELIRQRGEDEARRESEAIVAEARRAGERAVRNAQGELDRARASARELLRDELAERALSLARQQAQARVDGNVNTQLVQRFLDSLEHGGRN